MWVNESEKRFYQTRDGRVVEEGHPDAWSLIVGAGGTISIEEARKFGLVAEEDSEDREMTVPESKTIEAPARVDGESTESDLEEKAIETAPANKARRSPPSTKAKDKPSTKKAE